MDKRLPVVLAERAPLREKGPWSRARQARTARPDLRRCQGSNRTLTERAWADFTSSTSLAEVWL